MTICVKAPKLIPVGCHVFEVVFDNRLEDIHMDAQLRHMAELIAINPQIPDSRKLAGLIHETTHAVDNFYCNDKLGEELVTPVAEGLSQVLGAHITLDWSEIRWLEEAHRSNTP